MELKKYQKRVIEDLNRFLELLTEKQNIVNAYESFWEEKNVIVGFDGMPLYKSTVPSVPHICLKIPTGGGKTFVAASSIKTIFNSIPRLKTKAVVWLVPSDAILRQTQEALKNPDHPYRKKIDIDFSSRVEVYSKDELLHGQNFNPSTVLEQLSIFVLSYDSFRATKKEGRKAYKENGNLVSFSQMQDSTDSLLQNTDETALIQVIRKLNPLVIVDESHHATTDLSIEMLNNFNPSFILDLTATPRDNSNIISFVDAIELKREEMIKLPVIVYNRKTQEDVFLSAISLRTKLEIRAEKEKNDTGGRYIRPIVLFQAEPKINEDSTTYKKIKKMLVGIGIPEDQIAIKTADTDEIKNIDLLSRDCPIRYIITVNALKEGWDCPFAYILATVANRTSSVDVEQILGRVLRMPYAKSSQEDVLNLSYVITSSVDFHKTLDNVVSGLNSAGFSSRDYREIDSMNQEGGSQIENDISNIEVELLDESDEIYEISSLKEKVKDIIEEVDASNKEMSSINQPDDLLNLAIEQSDTYWKEMDSAGEDSLSYASQEVREKMNHFNMNKKFQQEALEIRIPQFMIGVGPSLFSDQEYKILEIENLQSGFTLGDKDTQIDFSNVDSEIAKIDVDESSDSRPKAWRLSGFDSHYMKEWFQAQPSEKKLTWCKDIIKNKVSSLNGVNDSEIPSYVERIIDNLSSDQVSDLEQSPYPYAQKIKQKIETLLFEHQKIMFEKWIDQDLISCQPNYQFDEVISPLRINSTIPKSLYTAEEDMNDYERKVVWELSSLDNVKWWTRNISRKGFKINGAVNAYPDIILFLESGKVVLVETKGDYLDNLDSKTKAELGARWDQLTDRNFRYFMVFESKQPDYQGAYSYDRFMEIIKSL